LQPTSVHFIDAPVSGSVNRHKTERWLFVGASNEDFEVAKPYFVLGKIIHVGEPGVASSAKLAINYYWD
jgi:3-hydroxyisobutyrate dehydrogenase